MIFLCCFVTAKDYVDGEIIVKYKDDFQLKVNNLDDGKLFYKIKVENVEEAVEEYKSMDNVEYVQPNYIYHINLEPNDSNYSLQWALPKINANKAWNITTGREDIVIAVIDTGVKWNHPDLNDSIWINEDEIPDNNIDDDGNGYVDDVRGYNFVKGDYETHNAKNDPMDNNGHGTHVAGIIASEMNDEGVVGICPSCKIMALRAADDSGDLVTVDVVDAVNYAIDNGARIISMSFGGNEFDNLFNETLSEAYNEGIILVASAGNDGEDRVAYPANYSFVIAVGNTKTNDKLSSNSNYGKEVEIAAPGIDIYSTYLNDGYDYMSGTSMACPYVSGSIGLILSYFLDINKEINQNEIINVLNLTGVDINYHFKRIDIYDAFKVLDYSGPSIDIISPRNISYNYNESLELNYNIYDINGVNSTWYDLDGNNMSLNGNILFNTTEGNHNLKLYGNDSLGNESFEEVSFLVDLTKPSINLSNISSSNNASVIFKYSVDDYGIENCSLIINDEINESSENVEINNAELFNVILSDGDYNYSVNCIDKAGNENTSIIYSLNVSCVENWECGSWGDSSNNCGTRQCVDYNYCKSSYSESKDCPQNNNNGGDNGGGGGSSGRGRSLETFDVDEEEEEIIIPEENITSKNVEEEKVEEEVKVVEEKNILGKVLDRLKNLFPNGIPTGEAIREKGRKEVYGDIMIYILKMFKFILIGS